MADSALVVIHPNWPLSVATPDTLDMRRYGQHEDYWLSLVNAVRLQPESVVLVLHKREVPADLKAAKEIVYDPGGKLRNISELIALLKNKKVARVKLGGAFLWYTEIKDGKLEDNLIEYAKKLSEDKRELLRKALRDNLRKHGGVFSPEEVAEKAGFDPLEFEEEVVLRGAKIGQGCVYAAYGILKKKLPGVEVEVDMSLCYPTRDATLKFFVPLLKKR